MKNRNMNKKTKVFIFLCILHYINTDEMIYENTTKEETNKENYHENVTIHSLVISDNETFYNTTDEYNKDLNNDDIAIVYDQDNTYVRECQYEKQTFVLDGQVVSASIGSSRPPHLWVAKCKPSFRVDAIFNVSTTIKDVFGLFVVNIKWPSIPESNIVEKAYLNKMTPVSRWGGCSKLTSLVIESPNFTVTPPDWLANCFKLVTIEARRMKLSQLKFILDSAPRAEELILRRIYEIDKIVHITVFPSARGAHQWISNIDLENYIDMNEIDSGVIAAANVSESLVWQLSVLPHLKKLRISSLKYFNFCATGSLSSVTMNSLQHLKLYDTDTHSMCLRETRKLPQLELLDLAQTNINKLQFGELYSELSPQLYVKLELTFVNQFTFLRDDYLALTGVMKKGNVTLNYFKYTIECDCGQSLWLTRALDEGVVTAPGITCRDGSSLYNQYCDWLYCNRVPCNDKCICCLDESSTVVGDCRDANISTLPYDLLNWSNLTVLLVPYNNLTHLPDSLPPNLKWLDLSGNDVFRKSGEAEISALFSAQERHVLLFGNAIICSCDTQPIIKILQDHKNQIEDYENLTCAGDNSKLSTVEVSALCTLQERQKTVIVTVSLLLFAALLFLLVFSGYYYRKSIQIFLFARGWCLFCIKEEELDAGRIYDVFLSFCYEDDRLIMEELLPVLDNEYSVCVHYRDWCPGDTIPGQIMRSVEQSRRTVVVVSRNFIKSLWGLLEFRTAHVSGLAEGRVRVVMIILDDVLEDENLEVEVKAYVRLNTYVKWGDPWFWDKLRFALPHHPTPFQRNLNNEHLASFLNVQLPMIEMPTDDEMLRYSDSESR